MARPNFRMPRERAEWLYSIVVLVAVPLLVVANTVFLTIQVRKNFDSELRYKADLANNLIAENVSSLLGDSEQVQSRIESIAENNTELSNIVVGQASGSDFVIVAATNTSKINTTVNDLQMSLAMTKNQSIAQLTTVQDERYWSVVTPVHDNGQTAAVIRTDVSLAQEDALIGKTLLTSLGLVTVTVIIIVLLLVNHFKFIEYAVLFKRLKEVDQLKNDFLSVATHELRTPMTVIKGNMENLIDGVVGKIDEDAKKLLQGMYAEADRLNALVNDLLNVSRIEQGRITFDYEVIDAREVLSDVVDNLRSKADDKGLQLEYLQPDEPVYVRVDKGRLIEITSNLVDNAIKYSREGTVTVSHKGENDVTRISVRDTGIGMSAADRERLFSRFYRIRNDKTKDVPGTGLGLWIIKQYVEKMGGKITVDSIEGEGSEFIVQFRLARHAPGNDEPTQNPQDQ